MSGLPWDLATPRFGVLWLYALKSSKAHEGCLALPWSFRCEPVAFLVSLGGAFARSYPVGGWKSMRGAAFTHLFAASVVAEYRIAAERHTGFVLSQ